MNKIATTKFTPTDKKKGMIRVPKPFRHLIKRNSNGKVNIIYGNEDEELNYDRYGRIGYHKEWFKDLNPPVEISIFERNIGYEIIIEKFTKGEKDKTSYKKVLSSIFNRFQMNTLYSNSGLEKNWAYLTDNSPINPEDLFDYMLREGSIPILDNFPFTIPYRVVAYDGALKKEHLKINRWLKWMGLLIFYSASMLITFISK